jgi:hypothetical protein
MKQDPPSPSVLNITYFIDPERKRHLQVPLTRILVTLSCAGVFIVGSMTAMIWLAARVALGPTASPWLEGMAASLNDAPEHGGSLAAAAGARAGLEAAATAPAEDAAWDAPAAKPAAGAGQVAGPVEATLLAAAEPKQLSKTVGITTPSFEYGADGFHTKFSVMNNGADEVQGTVWGFATFETETGETLSVPSHASLDASALDDMRHVEQGTPYKAKRLTNKELDFKYPTDKRGRFTEVRIAVGERARAQLVVATFALEPR